MIILGDFGVLTPAPFRNNGKLEMLPGGVEYLNELVEQRKQANGPSLRYAIMGNKGGVAYGLQTEDQAKEELRWAAKQIQAVAWVACFAHPTPAKGLERYADPKELLNRKPEPAMIEYLIQHLGVERTKVLIVGNYGGDGKAAIAANLPWRATSAFFKEAERKALAMSTFGDDPDLFLDPEMEG